MKKFALILLATAAILAGCGEKVTTKVDLPAAKPDVAPMATPDTSNPEEAKKYRAELEAAKKAYESSKSAYSAAKSDAKAKDAYIKSTVSFGTTTMNSPVLSPKEKYGAALNLYREALAIDPQNEEATNNKELIESIYKQMGKKVPS